MTDSGTVDIHIGPYDYTNDIRVNLWLSCDVPFVPCTLQNSVCIGILLSRHHAHYTIAPVTSLFLFLVDVFRHPRDIVTTVWPDDDGCSHTEGSLRISLYRQRSKSHPRAIRSLVKLPGVPESSRNDHLVTDDVWATPNPLYSKKWLWNSHGLRSNTAC